jgi:hypothetical protein
MRMEIFAIPIALSVAMYPGDAGADQKSGIEAFRQGNFAAAFTALAPLARGGDATAQFYLAEMFLKGLGVPQDFIHARKWYQLAAEGGLPEAQAALAGLYLLGLGTKRDYQAGYYWTVISVIWSNGRIRELAMRGLSEVSRTLEPQDKADIARDAAAAWRR